MLRLSLGLDAGYGDYLLGRVSKVFPELRREVLADEAP